MASLPKHPCGGEGLPGGAALGLAAWVAQRRLLPGGAGQRGPGSLLPVPPSLWLQTGRAGTAGRWRPQELTPLWASLPPPPYFGGKAAEQPLIGSAGRRGAGGGEGGRVCLFSILVSPSLFLFPQVSCFSSSFPSACSLP